MLQLILLGLGIVYVLRRLKLVKTSADDYPGIDPMTFGEWRRAQRIALDMFIGATWGFALLQLLIYLILLRLSVTIPVATAVGTLTLTWFCLLGVAWLLHEKAKGRQRAAMLGWPRRVWLTDHELFIGKDAFPLDRVKELANRRFMEGWPFACLFLFAPTLAPWYVNVRYGLALGNYEDALVTLVSVLLLFIFLVYGLASRRNAVDLFITTGEQSESVVTVSDRHYPDIAGLSGRIRRAVQDQVVR